MSSAFSVLFVLLTTMLVSDRSSSSSSSSILLVSSFGVHCSSSSSRQVYNRNNNNVQISSIGSILNSAANTDDTTTTTTTTTPTTTNDINTKNTIETINTDDIIFNRDYEIETIPLRIGHGFDIHRMAPINEAGQPIVIGGVTIVHKPLLWTDSTGKYTGTANTKYETLLGVCAHSDGDVIYHSIVDAIFGALTLPDIGQIFQDTDPRWRGCDSSQFMKYAYDVMTYYGYNIGNIDVTLILERPKVASYKPDMKNNIVSLLHTTPGRVNIKARTHEQVDSIGELRSLACHVVITLQYVGKTGVETTTTN